ncbi:hypothetical protein MJ904_26130 [Massilia sp. MB5]|uniref:hypothetical protein n=1 Tax=Massilia sp. MB5 TaxID=2919578 RepID=UPI001F110BF8|nr:hypothetical protein [Massilia sp. MB5]UMR30418.1 hypothetical protein MJ904_26130 [Massilia sp. MB5]
MKRLFLFPCAVSALLLTACAADAPRLAAEKRAGATLESALADAERTALAGQADKAYGILKEAGQAYPAEKAPWLQMAQMKFDRGSYGEAIQHAQEALQRDPSDKQGNTIVAMAGLRLSTRALADLNQQNLLTGSVQSEAQELARQLRGTLGEDAAAAQRKPMPRKPAAPASSVPLKQNGARPAQSNNADPFGALK